MITLIWAQGINGEIGLNGTLPWHLPADMAHFKKLTTGNVVIMGRKTFESLKYRPLKDRYNIVLTREPEPVWVPPGVAVYDSIPKLINDLGISKAYVIGGAEIYNRFMPHADQLIVTHIDSYFGADTFMAPINRDIWKTVSAESHPADEKNKHSYTFMTYARRGRF